MAATRPMGNLLRVTCKDVDEWLRRAWPGRATYPDASASHALTTAINTIVDRQNATSARQNSIEAAKERRARTLKAQKHARGLLRTLTPIMEYQQPVVDMVRSLAEPSRPHPASEELAVIENLHRAVESFLALGPPVPVRDHQDPILWIAEKTKQAWSCVGRTDFGKTQRALRFGKKPDNPLLFFIAQVLEAIGYTSDARLDTICDHLRERQNRPRDRGKARREGAK